MLFENKNLSPNSRLKRLLYRENLNCKFRPNRFLNLRFSAYSGGEGELPYITGVDARRNFQKKPVKVTILHFVLKVITFCVAITFCLKSYYILSYYYIVCELLHFVA